MTRRVAEWIGATPDTAIPPRVRERVFLAHGGVCHISKRKIAAGEKWDCDHVIAIINGGENRESNLAPALRDKHREKTAADVAEKARIAAKRQAHRGIVKDGPKMKGQDFAITKSRADKLAKRVAKQQLAPRPLYQENRTPTDFNVFSYRIGIAAQSANWARDSLEHEHRQMREVVGALFGSDDLEFSNCVCMADGIRGHVYHPASAYKGIGKRVCIFCGCDDFDF